MAIDHVQANAAFTGAQDANILVRKPQTYWGMALASLRRDRLTLVALGFVAFIALLALGAGAITAAIGVSPTQTNPANQFQQPYLWPYIQWTLGLVWAHRWHGLRQPLPSLPSSTVCPICVWLCQPLSCNGANRWSFADCGPCQCKCSRICSAMSSRRIKRHRQILKSGFGEKVALK